jgi:SAM-dependent methyltransferase
MLDQSTERLLEMIRGYWVSQILGTLAKLGIPDRLGSSPVLFRELAERIDCEPESTYRLLRAAASVGLVSCTRADCFALTPMGSLLRSNVPGSLRDWAIALTAPPLWLPWGRLAEAVRLGERQTPATLGRELFQYYAENPEEGETFTRAMSNISALIADAAANLIDTSTAEHVVDVGGAFGTIVLALLAKNPSLWGTIFEVPQVAPLARQAICERNLSSRCVVLEGDFFQAVPEADIHILKSIIHDWDDDQSIRILTNCARALRPNGRVILLESIVPEDGRPSYAPLSDLNMLVLLPGRERTASQYGALAEAAGLHLDRVVGTGSPVQILEISASPPR